MIQTGIRFMVIMTLLTGVIYPVLITAIAQLVFPKQANGVTGDLIGQSFNAPNEFWGRPSETQPQPYNVYASSGSNLGPSNPVLIDKIEKRIALLRQQHPNQHDIIPVDLVTASGSGLDPHISPAAAYYQISRVAQANRLPEEDIHALVESHIEPRTASVFGEPRVNVVTLNLALSQLRSPHAGSTSQSR